MGWEARKWIQKNNENKKIMQNWRIMLKYKKITVKWNKIWKERSACLESVADCNLSESASIYFQFHMPFSQRYLPIPPSGGGGVYVETKENVVTAWTSKVRLPDFQGWVVEDRHAFPLPPSGHVLWEPWTDREGAWLSWGYCAAETTWRNYLQTEIMFQKSQLFKASQFRLQLWRKEALETTPLQPRETWVRTTQPRHSQFQIHRNSKRQWIVIIVLRH